jgi:hypothetical protein
VFAAYGWAATLTDAELLQRLLKLNHERAVSKEKVNRGSMLNHPSHV